MITIVFWKWKGERAAEYTSERVNVAARAVAANLRLAHRFVCITDDPAGLAPHIAAVPLPPLPGAPSRNGFRTWVKLRIFDPDFARELGRRLLMLDIDMAVTGDLTPLLDRPEPIVCWHTGPVERGLYYQGGIVLMDAGARPEVWESFDPATSPAILDAAGYAGDDQAWMSYCLWPNEATWPAGLIVKARHIGNEIPRKARMVHFPGVLKPWHRECRLRTPRLARAWERYAR